MEIDEIVEQRVIIKFLIKSGKTNAEIKSMLLSVFGDRTLKRSAIYDWIGGFRGGREQVLDDTRDGQPRTVRTPVLVAKIEETINVDRRNRYEMLLQR